MLKIIVLTFHLSFIKGFEYENSNYTRFMLKFGINKDSLIS